MRLTTHTIDSALGRWTHSEWRPPALADAVEGLWHFAGRVALLRERTFPGGHVELILHLGPRYRAVDGDGGTAAPFPLACVSGVQTAPLVVEAPTAPSCVLGVRLRPAWAHALLGCPLPELTARTVDLVDVVGRVAGELAGRCHEAPTVEARFAHVAAWIAARLARHAERRRAPHPGVAWAAARLEETDGQAAVAGLRESAGLGRTRFAERFREQVGLAPKRYARVLRFRRALTLVQGGARLSDAALAAGYYDQAHLHADFREFAGMTPAEYAAAVRYHNSPSLAEPA